LGSSPTRHTQTVASTPNARAALAKLQTHPRRSRGCAASGEGDPGAAVPDAQRQTPAQPNGEDAGPRHLKGMSRRRSISE
jgi:hypothetical protein